MSVAGLCVVNISGSVWSGEVAEPIGNGVPHGHIISYWLGHFPAPNLTRYVDKETN